MMRIMRTTLDLDDDVLEAVKEMADLRQVTAGKIVSDLIRKAVRTTSTEPVRNGVPLLPRRSGRIVTMKHVNELRDAE
jgi:Arc/MetJ family transcription regulator